MSEAAFPVLGAAFVLVVVLPLSALLAKAALVLLERDGAGGALNRLSGRYVLLTASSVLPLAWFLSAGIHQAETGRSALACLLDHDEATRCLEPALFVLLLAAAAIGSWFRALPRAGAVRVSRSRAARALGERLIGLVAGHSGLAELIDRVAVTEEPGFTLGTRGLLRPRVYLGAKFAGGLTDDMLASALAHEREHVRSWDPLRYLVLRLALGINPFGRFLLAPHAARWRGAREAHCDREAVIRGAAPLAMADAIVRAARPTPREAAPLGANETSVLELRIGMLLAFAERPPEPCRHEHPSSLPVALGLLVVALLLPHRTGTEALDVLHTRVEQALGFLLR